MGPLPGFFGSLPQPSRMPALTPDDRPRFCHATQSCSTSHANFAFVWQIIAIGMTAGHRFGGIDLSVGSMVVLSAMVISVGHGPVAGLSGFPPLLALRGASGRAVKWRPHRLPAGNARPFVVTLGTCPAARSLAWCVDNKMNLGIRTDNDLLLLDWRRLDLGSPASALCRNKPGPSSLFPCLK